MDSNEGNDDKILESSSEMEVSDSNTQDKESEKQSDNVDTEMMTTKENKNENNDELCVKANETQDETVDNPCTESAEINTAENDSKAEESENKEENNKPLQDSKVHETEEDAEIDKVITPVRSVTPKETKEGKRKRKSAVTPPASDTPAKQNGSTASKRKKVETPSDRFCWRCHKESVETQCSACPRSWHRRCMGGAPPLSVNNWICGECASILQAENAETRSPAMAQLTVDQLCMMLKHVVERMRDQHGSEPFWKAVDLDEVPNYLDYVVRPMDLSLLESNVRAKLYGSTDAFMADARWIQHNCIVFNTYTSKLTNTAKQMLKVARQEVSEIEACPDCFAHGRNLPRPLPSWFIEPCRRPHPIVWAKLKGFPFWPAKALPRLNTQGLVDVRFFGEHDRAWVSPKDIYLYSQEPPSALPRKKKIEMEQCVKEVEDHSKKLEEVFGEFRYAPPKVQYDPHDSEQIKLILPDYDPTTNTRTTKSPPTSKPSTPANNKAVSPKVEKKTAVVTKNNPVASTNGVVMSPTERRKLVRKRKSPEEQNESVNNEAIVIESVNPTTTKSKSKSPPALKPVDSSETVVIVGKSGVNNVIEVCNNNSSPKNIVGVKRVKSDSVKKIKITKDLDKEELKRATIKNTNGKTTQPVPALNSLYNNAGIVKTIGAGQKPKTLYIQNQSNMKVAANLVGVNTKTNVKTPQSEGKGNKAVNKTPIKDPPKFPVNTPQKSKENAVTRPMTAIPVSTKKDQSKAMYLMMNSNTTESARHFNEKDIKLNSAVTIIKQEPKDDVPQPKVTAARKPSKARKSFPNKATNFPRVMSPATSYSASKSTSATDAMVYIPPPNNEVPSSYELPPPEAGPATAKIHNNSKELANRVAQLIADTIKDAAENNGVGTGNIINHHEATIHYLKLRMERMKWEHQQEIYELKHNNDLVVRELKASMEVERYRALQDARREAEIDKLRCIEETKRKQWCVVCGREAMFYCCWNTAYCDYPCQQKHWSSHIATCAQKAQTQTQQKSSTSQHTGTAAKSQQVMPKLVIHRPQQQSILRRA